MALRACVQPSQRRCTPRSQARGFGGEQGRASPSVSPPPPAAEAEPQAAPPPPSREAVLRAAVGTSAALAGAGCGARLLLSSAHLVDCSDSLPLLPLLSQPQWPHLAAAAAAAAGVTGARLAARAAWPAFRDAGDVSGAQLRNLSAADTVLVAAAAAAGEELLFRDALLPAVAADWHGALVAGAVFGALHVSGGRNVAYALWATVVGVGYGLLALGLRDGWSPVAAHALANVAGGLLWREEARRREEAEAQQR